MNPRLRRLQADHAHIAAAFAQHPYVRILRVEGNPPEKYVLEFNVLGLVPAAENQCARQRQHQVEISLSLDYPRRPPLCRMLTPLFHPNVDPQKICIGDHWSAGQSLPQLAVRIAEMIAFQSYNVKSPLNAVAAAWTEQHLEELPLEKTDLGAGL